MTATALAVQRYEYTHGAAPLPQLLKRRAEENGDLIFVQEVNGGSCTYGEFYDATLKWGGALASLGIADGAPVSTFQPGGLEALQLWIGVSHAGGVQAAVHPAHAGDPLVHAINSVKSEVLVVAHSLVDRIAAVAPRLEHIRHVVVTGAYGDAVRRLPFGHVVTALDLLAADLRAERAPEPWEYGALLYTSGTTGFSKAVCVPWAQFGASVGGYYPLEDFTAEDRLYVYTPSSHVGFKLSPYMAAILGARVILKSGFRASEFWQDVLDYGVTAAGLVGNMADFVLAQESPAEHTLAKVGLAPSGPFAERMRKALGVRTCTKYSTTELAHPIVSGWDADDWRTAGHLREGYPYFEARLVDEHDLPVVEGTVGELILRTAEPWTLTTGYVGQPEATARAWRNGWFHTGDMFRRDSAGCYYFIDRATDKIRRRGENIPSHEVEAAALRFDGVAEAAAVAVGGSGSDGAVNDDEIKICLVADAGATIDVHAFTAHMKERLSAFMVPRYVEVLDFLPKTPGTLRVQKTVLRRDWDTAATWDRLQG